MTNHEPREIPDYAAHVRAIARMAGTLPPAVPPALPTEAETLLASILRTLRGAQ